jgi:hypothetical protein
LIPIRLDRPFGISLADDINDGAVSWRLLGVYSFNEVRYFACFGKLQQLLFAFFGEDDFVVDLETLFEGAGFTRIRNL